MPNARITDPQTSHDAAGSVWQPTVVQQRILDILDQQKLLENYAGLTDDAIYQAFVDFFRLVGGPLPTPQSVRSRRSELEKRGLVVHTGLYGLTVSGRRTQKWGRA